MTADERQQVADMANFIWRGDGLTPGEVTPEVAEVVAEAFHSAVEKSKLINMLPRPAGFRPGLAWLVTQAVQAFWRSKSDQILETARSAAAYQYRTHYQMAKQGL